MIIINTGATANDGTGDKLRDAFTYVNNNFSEIQSILNNVLTGTSSISINQITNLQSILDDLTYQVSLIPGLQDDINSINSTIFTINQTLNSQNSSINELYSLVNDLQQQIFTKIGEAPIDGQQYVRKDAGWVVATGGVTFSQLLENVTPDGYLGLRLQPASASNNGFYINKSTNQSVGYYARNTDNVGNGAVSALYLGGSGGLYDNYVSLFHANAGYSIPYLRNKNGLISNNDLFFIGWQGASFDFVTSAGSYGSETSKFRITNSGTVSIGVTPSLDNTTTDILGRKADGTIVRLDKSSIGLTGITALNSLVGTTQSLITGTTGTDFTISSTGSTHTFNLPTASATNRGLLSSEDWTTFNNSFELNFLRQNVAYIQPQGLVNIQPSFNVSPNISSWGLTLQGATNVNGIAGFVRFNTTATAGTLAFRRGGFGIILGGYQFEYTQKVRFQTNLTGQRGLWGLSSGYTYTSPTNVEPNTNIDVVGVCQLSTSTNLHIIHNDGTGTATTSDLGANYPCNTNIYTYYVRIKRTTADFIITVERLTNSDNSTISTVYTTSTNIPAFSIGSFSPINYITNNAQSATASYFDGGCIAKITHQ